MKKDNEGTWVFFHPASGKYVKALTTASLDNPNDPNVNKPIANKEEAAKSIIEFVKEYPELIQLVKNGGIIAEGIQKQLDLRLTDNVPQEETKSETTTVKTEEAPVDTTQSEIEAKKADIERRRQDELKSRVVYDRFPTVEDGEFKIVGDPNNRVYRINENTGRPQELDESNGLWSNTAMSPNLFNESTKRSGFEKSKNKINAKYDAELKALEETTENKQEDIENKISISISNEGWKPQVVKEDTFDARLDTVQGEVKNRNEKQKEFNENKVVVFEVERKGETYIVAQVGEKDFGGRTGLGIATIKKEEGLPSDINDILVKKAVTEWLKNKDFSEKYPDTKNKLESAIKQAELKALEESPTEEIKKPTATTLEIERLRAEEQVENAKIERRRKEELNSIEEVPKSKGILGRLENLIADGKYQYKAIYKGLRDSEEITNYKFGDSIEEFEKEINAKYDKELADVYNKYNALITPLLEKQSVESKQESTIDKVPFNVVSLYKDLMKSGVIRYTDENENPC
jgi:hypothetical protein